jgi:hypothetical protein
MGNIGLRASLLPNHSLPSTIHSSRLVGHERSSTPQFSAKAQSESLDRAASVELLGAKGATPSKHR